ncbi:IPT/TIG domain-containing protein [Leptospira sp. 201903070]|uniref:IPT/TIG domain-containing protein n=1 Tax=Leptospira ainlahdjerensis TaxID=2810033 RepID=A0ABS2UGY8_9LEPT|nr:IPT/TIG domain-containing protein [Leptospira ainlahdjerensis]MBM9578813.1 IPT/TIG domain-containing protein [Leptospira ainlahdjerensis]
MKKMIVLIEAATLLFLLSACKKGGSDDDTTSLISMFTVLNSETGADFYPELGIPGSTTTITGNEFSGISSQYSVTINGVGATGINLVNSNTLTFTMPTLSDISENKSVPIVISRSGSNILSKTIRYRPAPVVALNQPNALIGRVSSKDVSSFYTFTTPVTGDHIVNIFGYIGANLDLYYYTSPSSVPTVLATGTAIDSEFEKVHLAAGTYIVQIKFISGAVATNFKTHIANGQITPASTFNEIDSQRRCYDYMGTGTTANVAAGCNTVNAASIATGRTGRCTYPSSSGLTTRSYYSIDGFGFDPMYAEQTCTQEGFDSPNPSKAIFQSL